MRLSKIKLAGFKSFVDPTTIHLPSNLIGIVGPNGCGKSNVIDAVRWVMGESSAKHLRGDSMTDVIFNGSSGRKPVGMASIELVFDNSDGAIGGAYANYNEISVKRALGRDGTSTYYLNNTRCRRKDITHIFLGTGLGPRSYAIIEQGMISRVIEARPEEMRTYLEEAAGISRYKERRRETENRIRHTRENLDRLNDLRDEVEKQLRRLQRQASMAEKYKTYKQEQRRLGAELLSLRLRDLDARRDNEEREVAALQNKLESAIADQRGVEKAIEQARAVHAEKTDAFAGVQEQYYKVGAEIARLEQHIQHSRELRARQKEDLDQAGAGLAELEDHIAKDREQIDALATELGDLEPELLAARDEERDCQTALEAAQKALQSWQADFDEYNSQAGTARQSAEVERARIEQLESRLKIQIGRRERVTEQRDSLSVDALESQIAELTARDERHRTDLTRLGGELDSVAGEIDQTRARDRELTMRLDDSRGELQTARGRLASLDALQQAALGTGEGKVTDWLKGKSLDSRPRLAQQLSVEGGWETAVETVLGDYLEAVCVDGLDAVAEVLGGLEQGTVSFVEAQGEQTASADRADLLAARVSGPAAVEALMTGVRAVDGLDEAMRLRSSLGSGESLITRDGIWIGRNWLRVSRDADEHAGVLSRETEIRELRERVSALSAEVTQLESEHQENRERIADLELKRDEAQAAYNSVNGAVADVAARLEAVRNRFEQTQAQRRSLEAEAEDLDRQVVETEQAIRDARATLARAVESMSQLETRRGELEASRQTLSSTEQEARVKSAEARNMAQELAIRVEARRSTRDSAGDSLSRMEGQQVRPKARCEELTGQLEQGKAPLVEKEQAVKVQLDQRIAVEANMADARRAVETADSEVRTCEQKRTEAEEQVAGAREALDGVRMSAQETRVRRDTCAEQFAQTGFDLAEVRETLGEDAAVEEWEERADKMQRRIDRLGPINLAAIDEFAEQSERKQYLDAQHDDLTEALETLEGAIRKVDKETRARFRETFDKVDAGLRRIFPQLFGGGQSHLELDGDDLLTAGVTVMARPPGKRISTIHLLSGGEKALTAVALVFSIFELNPAPFCLLDEVDAPLDDANVGRFCDIVRQMSERVQFMFITHNKTTIELANQLTGVTMHEPGVSRLVAVDVDEAVQMAAV